MSEREEELASITAIYPEIVVADDFTANLDIAVSPAKPVHIQFPDSAATLHYLPPLQLRAKLPENYPDTAPPVVTLSTPQEWLPVDTVADLQIAAASLWEEYGRCQILFLYIDHLQQCLDQLGDKKLIIPAELESYLRQFDKDMTQSIFDAGTYDCGICLEPKKGKSCYKLEGCGHVFCKPCFLDFYNNAITEGDVGTVRCLDPECGKGGKGSKRSLHPRELLAIGLEESTVRRYVVMKRKKKMESDKTTIYCPRSWCQQPARSLKYPPIPTNLLDYVEASDHEEGTPIETRKVHPAVSTSGEDERLAVCEACKFAFCRTCSASWHGSFVRCYPRDASELTAEEKASYDYITQNTSPCPTCSSPISKTMGCNHMHCFQCHTHFCYLCGAWLDAGNPYQHFNTVGLGCYQRLWELEEGDNGQGPEDGRGFAGARAMEAMAIEAAREADRQEALADAADHNPPVADDRPPAALPRNGEEVRQWFADEGFVNLGDMPPEEFEHMVDLLREWGVPPPDPQARQREAHPEVRAPQRRRRRPQNPFPANPRAQGIAAAIRAHERGGRRPAAAARPNLENDHEDELRRFVDLALRDEEDGWDSDELDGNDAEWRIA